MPERRETVRIRMRRKIGIVQSDGSVVHAWTYDLSHGGLQLLTDYNADEGDEFTLFMHLPQPQGEQFAYVEMRGRVVHVIYDGGSNGYRLGFRLVGYREGSRPVYEAFIDGLLGSALEERRF